MEIRNHETVLLPNLFGRVDGNSFFTSMGALVRNKRMIIMLSLALLFFAGHYYVYTTPIGMFREICMISSSALLGLGLFGSLFLFANAGRSRSRKIFAWEMLLVAFAAIFTLVGLVSPNESDWPSQFASGDTLIYGNIYAFVLLLYPFEVLYPGRMTGWRYFRLFLPVLLTSLFCYGYIRLSANHEPISNFYEFDTWFRFAIFACPIWLFFLIVRQKRHYEDWCSKNSSNRVCADLGWLNYYLFGYFLILASCVIFVLVHNYRSLIMLDLALLVFFGFAFFHILRQKEPALPNSSQSRGLVCESDAAVAFSREKSVPVLECFTEDRYRFEDKIPQYKADLERWMQEQKPYRDKDFKLLDVMRALPLNRSYISRLFNEGYGESFFNFVMRYRIEESIRQMEENPEMTIRCVSDMCGFSSPSVFGRAFLKNKGITPKQYRRNLDFEFAGREAFMPSGERKI